MINKQKQIINKTKDDLLQKLNINNKCAVIRPTGFGKTQMCVEMTKGKSYIYLCPNNPIRQDILLRYPHMKEERIVTYQELYSAVSDDTNIVSLFGDVELIILDELHRTGADMWQKGVEAVLDIYKDAKVIGCSANEFRCDGRSMVNVFFDGVQVFKYDIVDAINDGILAKPHYVYAAYDSLKSLYINKKRINNSKNMSLQKKNQLLADLSAAEIKFSKFLNMSNIIKETLSSSGYLNRDELKFFVFYSSLEALEEKYKEVEKWFSEATGRVVTGYTVDYKSNPTDKNNYIDSFAKDRNGVFLMHSINMVNEGIHIKDITGVVMMRKTASHIIFQQQMGRAFEIGGNSPVIFDFVNNINRPYLFGYMIETEKTNGNKPESLSDYNSLLYAYDFVADIKAFAKKIEDSYTGLRSSFKEKEVEDIINQYFLGVSLKKIASKYNCDSGVIKRVLNENSIDIRQKGLKKFTNDDIIKICNSYSAREKGLKFLSKEYDASVDLIKELLKSNGIKITDQKKRISANKKRYLKVMASRKKQTNNIRRNRLFIKCC